MRRTTQKKPTPLLLSLSLALLVLINVSFGATALQSIQVLFNSLTLTVNGTPVTANNILYNGTTYVPLKAVSDLFGATTTWDGATKTVQLKTALVDNAPVDNAPVDNTPNDNTPNDDTPNIAAPGTIRLSTTIDAFAPTFSTAALGTSDIEAISLASGSKKSSVEFKLTGNQLTLTNSNARFGGSILDMNTTYTMKLYNAKGVQEISFKTGGLRAIAQDSTATVYYVPPIPEKGFKWPYLLRLPGKHDVYDAYRSGISDTLLIETANFGTSDSPEQFNSQMAQLYSQYEQGAFYSVDISRRLNLPTILPIFPRFNAYYPEGSGHNYLYTHALDRDTAIFKELLANQSTGSYLKPQFEDAGFNAQDFVDLDLQVLKMADHARSYLASNRISVDDKYFIYGYSAAGTFSDRLVSLYPERFKAYASGATLDDMVLPTATYKGKDLMFPIGVSDYKSITGKDFDLKAFNAVARMVHMGSEDTNNTLRYNDCYSDIERNLIKSLFAEDVKTRADQLIKAYKEVGGKGLFILDQGQEHGTSQEMVDYLANFFGANLGNKPAAYPLPPNPKQLVYTLYQ